MNDHNTNTGIRSWVRNIPKSVLILIGIILVGIFLRTYRFHDWLEFKTDQSRDASLVQDVVRHDAPWPLLGPAMGNYATDDGAHFRIGPIYYSFQILSAKVFGPTPDALAYPDLFFSILTIPLLYFFLRKAFAEKLSLWLTALYAVSFFAIRYSRFAWNSNLIPFFVLLFLLSLYEFWIRRERVSWWWVGALGVALGVGIQLHVITLILFSGFFLFLAIIMSIRWKGIRYKLLAVCTLALLLNAGQIRSEVETNFANARIFLGYFMKSDQIVSQDETDGGPSILNDVDCHIQGNSYMLTSLGEDSCSYTFGSLLSGEMNKNVRNWFFWVTLATSLAFSVLGYVVLFNRARKETDADKRVWFLLLASYLAVSFLVMLPVIKGKIELRYFSFAFFAPFLFLGFLVDYLKSAFPGSFKVVATLLFLVILSANTVSLVAMTQELLDKNRLFSNSVVLDEMDPIVSYMTEYAYGNHTVSLGGDSRIVDFAFAPLQYLSESRGMTLVRSADEGVAFASRNERPSFFINNKQNSATAVGYLKIGQKLYVHRY